jgi:hypothetical protein
LLDGIQELAKLHGTVARQRLADQFSGLVSRAANSVVIPWRA